MEENKPIHNEEEVKPPDTKHQLNNPSTDEPIEPTAETTADAEQPSTLNLSTEALAEADPSPSTVEDMEVHHHTHHEHGKRNWKSYFWEFLMLFLAVFCGFLAEYQLEHVIENSREKQFMKTMAEDLRSDSAALNRLIRLRKSRIRELDTLFHLIASDEYLINGRKVHELYEFPYWDIFRFHPSDRTMQQLKNGGNLRLVRKINVSNALIKYDVLVRNNKEYEPLQTELANQINQHLEKLLDPLIIEKSLRAYTDEQLMADTVLVGRKDKRNLPSDIAISKLADTDKKIFLKYINQVKTLYLQSMRDNMRTKKLAEETLALVTEEYHLK